MKSRFQENLNRGFQYQLIGTVETFLISKFYQKKHNLKKKYFSEKKKLSHYSFSRHFDTVWSAFHFINGDYIRVYNMYTINRSI